MALSFKRVVDSGPAVDYIAGALRSHLEKGEKVLWLLPGGSAIAAAAEVGQRLSGLDLSNLAVSLTDERYGEVGHADSNWRQLQEAGLDLPGARLFPVLTGLDGQATVARWQAELEELLTSCDYKLGFFGIGPDGHTAGVLPGSPAMTTPGLVALYDGGAFQRITTTPAAISRLDEAVVLAMGEAKRKALEGLKTEKPINEQPAQVLKRLNSCIIFNDVIGEEL